MNIACGKFTKLRANCFLKKMKKDMIILTSVRWKYSGRVPTLEGFHFAKASEGKKLEVGSYDLKKSQTPVGIWDFEY
jgi:hypothetical protein